MWTLGGDQPVIPEVAFIRLATALPLDTAGSLSPTFVSARPVRLAVSHPSAFALFEWFPSILRVTLGASVTLWEATAPVKLPTYHCPLSGLLPIVRISVTEEWYPNGDSTKTDVLASQSPTYPVHPLPKFNDKLQ